MTRLSTALTLAGVTVLSAAAPSLAFAQYYGAPYGYGYQRGYAYDGRYNPREGLQPNGCVRQCDHDMNPCDPPIYKQADGRCSFLR